MVESPDREAKASYKVKIQARILADEEDKAVVEKLAKKAESLKAN